VESRARSRPSDPGSTLLPSDRSSRLQPSGRIALSDEWWADHQLWVETFVVFNFAGLVGDIYLAHSENAFRRSSEYIPLVFSVVAAVVLIAIVPLRRRERLAAVWRDVGYLVGWTSVVVGLVGVILHLDSQFFYTRTIRSLTYGAPFAAPLAYTGLGLLLVANRMVDPETVEWPRWILLLALGGFAGNFVFSLTDHAMNGFFNPLEWVPVVSSAFAVAFLLVPFVTPVGTQFLGLCGVVLLVQGAVGALGFVLHSRADLHGAAPSLFERVTTGAPIFAPLLFPNLVILALVALWVMAQHDESGSGYQ
jgi:hypothetical protein